MTDVEKRELWERYSKTPTRQIRDQLIIEYARVVKIVAGRLIAYFGDKVEYEDMISYGTIGLIDAIDKYDLGLNVKFETYATLRIRGEIIDQVRKLDWVPRTIRQKQKQIKNIHEILQAKLGREPSDLEMIQELHMDKHSYYELKQSIAKSDIAHIDDTLGGSEDNSSIADLLEQKSFIDPEDNISKKELAEKLKDGLSKLTDNERKVIELYYYNDLTLAEIAKIMEVSESRVSQLHRKALNKLRTIMGEYMGLVYNAV